MITIINWSKYQSYKDRKPPWIRFHRSMIDNYEYQMMDAESRALLPMLWLLACEHEDPTSGIIDLETKVIAYRLRRDEKIITKCIQELEDCGFIDCAGIVTKPLRECNKTVTPETETETETETDKPPKKKTAKAIYLESLHHFVDEGLFFDFIEHRKKVKAGSTEKALVLLSNKMVKAKDAGHNVNQLIETAIERGWKTIFFDDVTQAKTSAASDEWGLVLAVIRDHGTRGYNFLDDRQKEAIKKMGGWSGVAGMTERDKPFKEKDFKRAYAEAN